MYIYIYIERPSKTFKEISNYSMLCTICVLFTSFADTSTQQLPVQYYSYQSNLNVVKEYLTT